MPKAKAIMETLKKIEKNNKLDNNKLDNDAQNAFAELFEDIGQIIPKVGLKIGFSRISLKWNPFRKLVTDRHHFFEYLLQSSWWEKVKDTWAIFAGKKQFHDYNKRHGEKNAEIKTMKIQRTIGVFDLLIVPLLLELMMYKVGTFYIKKTATFTTKLKNLNRLLTDSSLENGEIEKQIGPHLRAIGMSALWTLILTPVVILLLPVTLFNKVFDFIKTILAAIVTIPFALSFTMIQAVIALGKYFGKIDEISDERENAAIRDIALYEDSIGDYVYKNSIDDSVIDGSVIDDSVAEVTNDFKLPKDMLDKKNYHIDIVNVQENGDIQVTMTNKRPLTFVGGLKTAGNRLFKNLAKDETNLFEPEYKVSQFTIDMSSTHRQSFFKHNPYGITRKMRKMGTFSDDYSTFELSVKSPSASV